MNSEDLVVKQLLKEQKELLINMQEELELLLKCRRKNTKIILTEYLKSK